MSGVMAVCWCCWVTGLLLVAEAVLLLLMLSRSQASCAHQEEIMHALNVQHAFKLPGRPSRQHQPRAQSWQPHAKLVKMANVNTMCIQEIEVKK